MNFLTLENISSDKEATFIESAKHAGVGVAAAWNAFAPNRKEEKCKKGLFIRLIFPAFEPDKNECNHIIATLKEQLNNISEPKEVWRLEDYLSEKREEIDQKYDYRYSVLIRVFGILVGEGWIEMKDLDGLEEDKLQKIQIIAYGLNE